METKFLLVNSLTDSLVLSLFDYNDHRKNALLGASTFELSQLQEDAIREGIASPILKDGKERGELRYDVSYYPVVKPEEGNEELLASCTYFYLLGGASLIFFYRSGWNCPDYDTSGQGARCEQIPLRRPQPHGQALPRGVQKRRLHD